MCLSKIFWQQGTRLTKKRAGLLAVITKSPAYKGFMTEHFDRYLCVKAFLITHQDLDSSEFGFVL